MPAAASDQVLISCLRCRACGASLHARAGGAACPACGATYPLRDRRLDLLDLLDPSEPMVTGRAGPRPATGLGARLMQWPLLARLYERVWRPITCALVTPASFPEQVAMIRRAFSGAIRGPLLDLGTGTGNFSRALARTQPSLPVLAVDLSAPMLAVAAAALRREALAGVLLLRADATNLPIQDTTFESVLCCGTLHLLEDPAALLREAHCVLLPGGRFVCLTYLRDGGPLQRRALAHSRGLFGMEFFEPAQLQAMVRSAGFTTLGVERAGRLAVLSCTVR